MKSMQTTEWMTFWNAANRTIRKSIIKVKLLTSFNRTLSPLNAYFPPGILIRIWLTRKVIARILDGFRFTDGLVITKLTNLFQEFPWPERPTPKALESNDTQTIGHNALVSHKIFNSFLDNGEYCFGFDFTPKIWFNVGEANSTKNRTTATNTLQPLELSSVCDFVLCAGCYVFRNGGHFFCASAPSAHRLPSSTPKPSLHFYA